ncbi:MAG: zinc-dependent peptidase [Gammaproteobacteria bacterium]|nr:zinc-dependent peptidase [Gammaproteobacteria bacterium]MBU2428658.1 zinc-dependent peptidase [Gammaproteobacteria bacterium]
MNWQTAVILVGMSLIIGGLLSPVWRQSLQRQRIAATPFPTHWRKILKQQLPLYRALPADLQMRLKKLIQLFIAQKQFIGCEGLVITDEIRINIAAQACLLMLNRPTQLFPNLKSVLVYPAAYQVAQNQPDAAGVVHDQMQVRLGESWQQGKVVLSWPDSQQGAANPTDGHNVVLHEFAHQLDQENGAANGAPFLATTEAYRVWSKVLTTEFEALQHRLAHGLPSLFDPYAATNPAEFFAVITEVFFEQGMLFQHQHPKLYQQLKQYYRLDPALWTP